MGSYARFLMCCLVLVSAGCSKSQEPTVTTVSQPAASRANLATASPTNQEKQTENSSAHAEAGKGKVDACALLTSKEIESVQGEALKETKASGRLEGGFAISQCFYTLPTSTNSISLLVAQRSDSVDGRDPKEFWKETFQRSGESEKERDKDRDKDAAKGRSEDEEKSTSPQKIAGLGDDAYWTLNRVGGAVYALKGNTYIRISVGGPGDQAVKIKKTKALAQMILNRLEAAKS